jgi:L-seryl-tRNA(Ser) seleniumtransferase
LPLVDDLGSGTLVDLTRYGLARERTVRDAVRDGADIVTFSGDKLLGGPQAGFIVGRRDLVQACAKHPLKRAMRLDKIRLAALEATLALYRDPDRLAGRLPTLRALAATTPALTAIAERLHPRLVAALGPAFDVSVVACRSQIGSGALPLETIPSAGLAIRPKPGTASAKGIERLAAAFRALPVPVIGRLDDGALVLDLRGLDDEAAFLDQLGHLVRVA